MIALAKRHIGAIRHPRLRHEETLGGKRDEIQAIRVGNGIGRSRTPLTTVNIATVVPMPRVSVRIDAVVNAGARRSVLSA